MAFFSRQRGRARRVGLEKVRPPAAEGNGGGSGLLRAVLLGVFFAAILVLTISWGQPPLKYAPGDVASSDVTARVTFSYEDAERTREARENEKRLTPDVYQVDNAPLDESRMSLIQDLASLRDAKDPKVRVAEMGEDLPLPEIELPIVVADLKRADGGTLVPAVNELYNRLLTKGVTTDERAQAELASLSHDILIPGPAGRKSVRVPSKSLYSVSTAGTYADEFLSTRLGPVLKGTSHALAERIRKHMRATLSYDDAETQADRDSAARNIPMQVLTRQAGEILVSRGETIWRPQYEQLKAEQTAFLLSRSPVEAWKEVAGVALLIGAGFLLGGVFLRHYRPDILQSTSQICLLGGLVVLVVIIAKVLLHTTWIDHPFYLVPVAFASMILALAYSRAFACGATLFIVLMVGLTTESDSNFRPLLVLLAGGLVASLYTIDIRKRTMLLKVGLLTGIAHVVMIYGVGLGQFQGLHETLDTEVGRLGEHMYALSWQALIGLINGVGVGLAVTALLPFLEPVFRITTGISLLELGDLNQPVLKSFALRAPGSYNHSLSVAALGESAARAIGADDLLVRVGSYFHDIGKLNKPHYFVENQGDLNPHDRLSPHMSALIIIAHVKDGVELGQELGLPRAILDIIAEHHGTTTVEFFYRRAFQEAGEDTPPDDYVFRYSGPTPRSKETAVVMLADSVESASRTLVDPTPASLENLVQRIVDSKLGDGQLDDCSLTLGELHAIEESLTKGLISIFHGRIKY